MRIHLKIYKKQKKHYQQKVNVLALPILNLLKIFSLFSLKNLVIFSFISVILALTFYVFQVTNLISEKYQIQNYQNQIDKISEKNTQLEVNLAKITSLKEIDKKIEELGFEKNNKVYYIHILESPVVKINNKTD